MAIAFINYRRSDAAQAAQGLFAQLRARFGPTHVFLDVSAILPGALWSDRLRQSLDDADVLLSVIGPRWLKATNEFGQRRIDEENDWVRNEIEHTLQCNKPIIPLLVAGADSLPPPEGLPPSIRRLLGHQRLELRDEKWDRDLDELIGILESEHGFVSNQAAVSLPQPELTISALTAIQLEGELTSLVGWKAVESMVPLDYPKPRQELRKIFRFKSFKSAIEFMQSAVPIFSHHKHHPRWENQWRSVTVYLTTWDIGYRISAFDVKIARELDDLFQKESK